MSPVVLIWMFHLVVLIWMFNFSLLFFFLFRSLSCQRITLHKNLFFSFVLNSVVTIIWFGAVVNNQEIVQRNPVSGRKTRPPNKIRFHLSSPSVCRLTFYHPHFMFHLRPAAKCLSSSICTCLGATTSGCCARGSICTRSLWWLCLRRSSTWCGTICWAGVSLSTYTML